MKSYILLGYFALFTVATAFTVYDKLFQNGRNDSGLELADNKDCNCVNSRCVYNRGKTKCVCYAKHSPTTEENCQPCDCGKLGECIFVARLRTSVIEYEKKCVCNKGSAEKDGICVNCNCGENSKCEFEGDERTCYCLDGYAEKDGVCVECNCGKYGECTFENGQKTCSCFEGFLLNGGICEECDCGEYGKCSFQDGKKFCDCFDGYKDNDGYCDECKCGENSYGCDYVSGEKRCLCNDGFIQDDGICKECDCGKNGRCALEDDKKVCYCSDGYKVNGGYCEECKCGENSYGCDYVNGDKKCWCNSGYHVKDGICEECNCGEHGKCSFREGRKTCNCSYGYKENDGHCDECECGVHTYGCEYVEGKKRCWCNYGYSERDGTCVVNQCLQICGEKPDVLCYGDPTGDGSDVNCGCEKDDKIFSPESKECRVNMCVLKCGRSSGVVCHGDPLHEVDCSCADSSTAFVDPVTGCKDCNCGDGSYGCEFYGVDQKSCKCKEGFVEKNGVCEVGCGIYQQCENGGECKEGFCKCPPGTYGEFCEVIKGCETLCPEDAECFYNIDKQQADCKCRDSERGFDPETKSCKRTCDDNKYCENGGKCSYNKFCDCLPGTSGEFCEKIDECPTCEDGAYCVFNVEEQKAMCLCPKEGRLYDYENNKCRGTCDDYNVCENGGKCGYNNFCDCLPGTSGEFCENIDECPTCEDGAYCVFDTKDVKAICSCTGEGRSYDYQNNKCKVICGDNVWNDCKNGGKCDGTFCICPSGTSGDLCDDVDECIANPTKCKNGSECVYSIDEQRAYCRCPDGDAKYDPESQRCRISCRYREGCKNGGECQDEFCNCVVGTSGDLCEDVDECLSGICGDGDDVSCYFDLDTRVATCKCEDSKIFDPVTKMCRACDCGTNAIDCTFTDGEKVCHCPNGFETKDGTCERIKCDIGTCEKNYCHIINKEEECTCEEGYIRVSDECARIRCDIGTCKENYCPIINKDIKCTCEEGYIRVNDDCAKTRCTEKQCYGGKCEVINGEEVCRCFEGYGLDGDYCRKLNCSNTPCKNGTCVVRQGNIEECICPAGHSLIKDVCIRGSCRIDTCFGGHCATIDGELMCVCPKGYELKGIGCFATVCEIQHCFGGYCVVNDDREEICTCHNGYYLENDVCKKILCARKRCFGGHCNIENGEEVCTCPAGHILYEDVCRRDLSEQ